MSGRRGSNPPPSAWKADALPNELLPLFKLFARANQCIMWGEKDSNLRSFRNGFTVRPIWPLWYLPCPKHLTLKKELSRWRDSNPRPADYKSAALAS